LDRLRCFIVWQAVYATAKRVFSEPSTCQAEENATLRAVTGPGLYVPFASHA